MSQVPAQIVFPRTMKDILRDVAEEYDVPPAVILTHSAARWAARPRQDFMWRCRQIRRPTGEPRYSYPQIGRFLGRHYTTVIHGVSAHEKRVGA